MYILMIYELIFEGGALLLCSSLKTKLWIYTWDNNEIMSQSGHYTMTCGRYIKRWNMWEKCFFLPLKGSNFHLKYNFPVVPFNLSTTYRNFAQSPFNEKLWGSHGFQLNLALISWFLQGSNMTLFCHIILLHKSYIYVYAKNRVAWLW